MNKAQLHRYTRHALALALLICFSAPDSTMAATPRVSPVPMGRATPTPKAAPSIATVLANVEQRLSGIQDISGTVDLEQVSGDGSVVQAQTTVQARLPNLMRLSFTKPEAFAGSIYVLDRKENKVMQYSPITEQVIISGIDQVLSERYVPTTVEQLFSLPSPDDYELAVLGTESSGSQDLVCVSARARADKESPIFHFWIDQQQWMVSRMKVFDAQGQLLFTIALRDMRFNRNLTDAQLRKMPPGAVPVYR